MIENTLLLLSKYPWITGFGAGTIGTLAVILFALSFRSLFNQKRRELLYKLLFGITGYIAILSGLGFFFLSLWLIDVNREWPGYVFEATVIGLFSASGLMLFAGPMILRAESLQQIGMRILHRVRAYLLLFFILPLAIYVIRMQELLENFPYLQKGVLIVAGVTAFVGGIVGFSLLCADSEIFKANDEDLQPND